MNREAETEMKGEEEEYISEGERRQLLSALHSRLFWVGQRIPDHLEVEGKDCPLHEYVWELIRKDSLTAEEKEQIEKCIETISAREKEDEKELEEMPLTREEARALYRETAGLLRALMDLRDIEDGTLKEKAKNFQEKFAEQRVRDARRWLEFLKEVKNK